jgi:cardiolipin synthase
VPSAGGCEQQDAMSYIFESDRVGNRLADSLVAAWQRGVQVRVLIDDVGSKYSEPNMVRQLASAGIPAAGFLPTRLPRLPTYANLRNHRKIMVVDGQIGFTGGTNIRDAHCLSLQPQSPVQCLHFRLAGPIVSHLQEVFASDWAFATHESLVGETWFPPLERTGVVWCRGVEDGPDEDFEKMSDLIAGALCSATERVRVVTPYFLPNSSLIQLLNVTAMRGVQVEILLPEENNIRLVQWATAAQLSQLLKKGCRVYCTSGPFDHTKLLILDDVWTLIGSSNWDPRSLRLNFEFNVECYDVAWATEMNALVDAKAAQAREVTLEEINARSIPVRLRDGMARLASPYL